MLPQLRKLERKYSRELVVVGVHSPKFITEQETESVRQAILRLNVGHPVINDRDFRMADAVRIVGAVALPVMLFVVAEYGNTHVWPLLTILALELAVGGLDNLLSHHKQASGALLWGARVGGVVALLGELR